MSKRVNLLSQRNYLIRAERKGCSGCKKKYLIGKFAEKEESLVKLPFDMDKITSKDSKSWTAVIHADGNNLGQKLIKMKDSF